MNGLCLVLVACFLWIYAAASIPQPPRVETRATPEEAAAIKRDIAIVILTSRYVLIGPRPIDL